VQKELIEKPSLKDVSKVYATTLGEFVCLVGGG